MGLSKLACNPEIPVLSGDTFDSSSTTIPPTRTIYLQDSTKIRKQEFLLVQSRTTITRLQDSLERTATRLASVVPDMLVRYRDTFKLQQQALIQSNESLKRLADSMSSLLKDPGVHLIPVPSYFSTLGKFHKIKGRILRDTVSLDSIEIYNKSSILIGSTGKWYQQKTLTVTIINSNPDIFSSGIQSYQYKPKEKRIGILVGPSLLFDTKDKVFRYGIGITGGYRLY